MPQYLRAKTPGASYFFTLVSYRRQPILCDPPIREALRIAINAVRAKLPFVVDAWVLMPDHLHCLWTLPTGDNDYPRRWSLIKRKVSLANGEHYKRPDWMTLSKSKHHESTIWQRRFWEHQIRDDQDYRRHLDYIHWNPVKHDYVKQVCDWPYSTFHRYVRQEMYPKEWGGVADGEEVGKFGE